RFRLIPMFGWDTICCFANNASEMKKLAARDFEDLLQCSIPAFEGLLPEPHNKGLMVLLYRTAEWHGFTKLRLHTDMTLSYLNDLTKEFGHLMHQFCSMTCTEFEMVELPQELDAHNHREAQAIANGHQIKASGKHHTKNLNLFTYKYHAIGNYVSTI
ncbi:hypothetical protein FISHEDRAFT_38882, partial [Fistulina hepatica ATCC 64428]